jgi:hypothetical protein
VPTQGDFSQPGGNPGREPGFFTKLLGTAAVVAVTKRLARLDEERDVPRLVKGNLRAQMLAARADEMVSDGYADEAAVAELVELAKSRHSDLKTASAWARQDGRWTELEHPNHVVRILNAAATGGPVVPPRPEHAERFAELGRFDALPPAVAFSELKDVIPELADMEVAIRSAAERDRANGMGDGAGLDQWRATISRLRSVVGPDAHAEGILIRSSVARDVAWAHLARVARRPDR